MGSGKLSGGIECRACRAAGLGQAYGTGLGSFSFRHLAQHERRKGHKAAVARWSEDAPAAGRTTTEEGGGNPTTLRDLVLLRTLLETRGSFRDLDTWSRVDGEDGLGRSTCPRLLGTWAACALLVPTLSFAHSHDRRCAACWSR